MDTALYQLGLINCSIGQEGISSDSMGNVRSGRSDSDSSDSGGSRGSSRVLVLGDRVNKEKQDYDGFYDAKMQIYVPERINPSILLLHMHTCICGYRWRGNRTFVDAQHTFDGA